MTRPKAKASSKTAEAAAREYWDTLYRDAPPWDSDPDRAHWLAAACAASCAKALRRLSCRRTDVGSGEGRGRARRRERARHGRGGGMGILGHALPGGPRRGTATPPGRTGSRRSAALPEEGAGRRWSAGDGPVALGGALRRARRVVARARGRPRGRGRAAAMADRRQARRVVLGARAARATGGIMPSVTGLHRWPVREAVDVGIGAGVGLFGLGGDARWLGVLGGPAAAVRVVPFRIPLSFELATRLDVGRIPCATRGGCARGTMGSSRPWRPGRPTNRRSTWQSRRPAASASSRRSHGLASAWSRQ